MQVKVFAAMLSIGFLSASMAIAAGDDTMIMADNGMSGTSTMSGSPNNMNMSGNNTMSGNGNMSGAATMSGTASPNGNGGNDDMNPDTATGDDDY